MTDEITKAYRELSALIDDGMLRMGKTIWTNGEPDVDKWQPIETAPKDGTRILLYGYECETQWNVCYWVTEEEQGYTGWHGWDWPEYEVPSHWMPLPEPPK